MKIREKAEQKNVILDKAYYTRDELQEMIDRRFIFWINTNRESDEFIVTDRLASRFDMDVEYRIACRNLVSLDVALSEDGHYYNRAKAHDGKTYIVLL